jgi:phosphatidylserine/phosphatidylglycerophosphate/cardiolipin synthase-like enzyme
MADTWMWLLLATGFTGGLTFFFLVRWLRRLLVGEPSITASFTPRGGCIDTVVRELRAARREVLLSGSTCSSPAIAEALVKAKLRGLRVDIVLDPSSEKDPQSDLPFLVQEGIAPLLDGTHSPAHHQAVLIDGRTLLTGSFSFTDEAEAEGAESLLVIRGHPELVKAYRQQLEAQRAGARPAGGKADDSPRPAPARAATEDVTSPRKIPMPEAAGPRKSPAHELLAAQKKPA